MFNATSAVHELIGYLLGFIKALLTPRALA